MVLFRGFTAALLDLLDEFSVLFERNANCSDFDFDEGETSGVFNFDDDDDVTLADSMSDLEFPKVSNKFESASWYSILLIPCFSLF